MKKIILSLFLLSTSFSFSQTKEEIKEITKDYNIEWLNSFSKEKALISKTQKEKAIKLAKENNWPITFIDQRGAFCEIIKVENGIPMYYTTFNIGAAKSTRADFLHNGGGLNLNIEGQNMTAHVWDEGPARVTHVEFNVSGQSKITNGDGGSVLSDHATHVAGTIAAIGVASNAKGMAPHANIISYDWNYDLPEVTNAASNGMLISNHSYGAIAQALEDWKFGAYTTDCKDWDNLLFNAPFYTLVSAAGNDGNDNTSNNSPLEGNSGYDKLSYLNVAKNTIVVANANDVYTNSNGEIFGSMDLSPSSSQGPTDDYRIKPDITGNGTGVYSCTSTSDTSYDTLSGTSMASPNVAGSLLLLQQLYNQENGSFALSATIKGLALHTADDGGGIGPDAKFGWGYMNTKKAAEVILSDISILKELTLNENETITFEVVSDGNTPLVASISWTDPAPFVPNYGTANSTTKYLVNDLDIRITKNGTTFLPWKLTSVNANAKMDNNVDPFEKIEIENASGTYTVTISHKNQLRYNLQNFSLIVSGISSNNLVSIHDNVFATFKAYPNPVEDILTIEGVDIITNVTLFSLLGQKVLEASPNKATMKLDMSNLNNGTYFAKITINGASQTIKIIK